MAEAQPTAQTPESDTLNCPNCQGQITYYDITGSYFYGCPHCHFYFVYQNEGPAKKIREFPAPMVLPVLPIGTEGYLNKHWLRVVGYIYRKEQKGPYFWSEYALLDRKGVYSMLAEYDGHWTYIEKNPEQDYTERHATGKAYYVDTPERQYRLFNRYHSETRFVVGEFDWNVLGDDQLAVSEYIHPPYVLTCEKNKNQTEWYLGEYKTPEAIATAFGLSTKEMPLRKGIGANQPSPGQQTSKLLLDVTIIMVLILVIGQLLLSALKPGRTLHNEAYTTTTDTSKQAQANTFKPIITPAFEVNGPAMLAVALSSSLDNQWVELPVSLINEQTGQAYSFTKVLEYYYGTDGGESWSEGSRDDEAYLSRIPSGKYHLNLYPYAENRQTLNVSVQVRQVNPLSNTFIIAILLVIYPIFQYLRRRWFEYSRWSNSDYSDIESQ